MIGCGSRALGKRAPSETFAPAQGGGDHRSVSIPPWGVDRPPLVPETAATLIRASFASVDVDGIAHLGSGWDFDAFVTRDGWVFRFPRRAECAATLDAERRIHDLVARALPPSVAIPRFDLLGEPSAAFPYRFAGYRFISGVPADAVSPALLTTTALPGRCAAFTTTCRQSICSSIGEPALSLASSTGVMPLWGTRRWTSRRLAPSMGGRSSTRSYAAIHSPSTDRLWRGCGSWLVCSL